MTLMKVSYWSGEKVQLRAPEKSDLNLFESVDDEILKNLDSLAFPEQRNKLKSGLIRYHKEPLKILMIFIGLLKIGKKRSWNN